MPAALPWDARRKQMRGAEMTRRMLYAAVIAAVAAALMTGAAGAVTPANDGDAAGGATITIDNSPGDQLDPHVSGNLAAYTDNTAGFIRYYDFATSTDLVIPPPAGSSDTLSSVSGS